jgi:acetyl-CoA acyltransferase
MGDDGEIIASKYGVTREETDAFAARSHQLASKANEEGAFEDIIEVSLPPGFIPIKEDNGIRGDTTAEAIAKLKPVFDKKHGTFTAANSSFLTDGAAATLIMTEEKAVELNLKPKSRIVDFVFTGQSLEDELLLGPAYAIPKVLQKTGLSLDEIDFFELHEAFSGQVLAVLKALESDEFSRDKLGLKKSIGKIPMEKINTEGGSLSIGHPFGATGSRLLTMASNKLIRENGRYALIAACAAGAHGHAMIIEKYQ